MSWHLYSQHMIITFPHNAWLSCNGENNSSFYAARRWGDLLLKLQTDTAGASVAIPHAAVLSFLYKSSPGDY